MKTQTKPTFHKIYNDQYFDVYGGISKRFLILYRHEIAQETLEGDISPLDICLQAMPNCIFLFSSPASGRKMPVSLENAFTGSRKSREERYPINGLLDNDLCELELGNTNRTLSDNNAHLSGGFSH